MKQYLQKTWFRIIISLLGGGLAAEMLHIFTGDPNRKMGNGSSFILLGFATIFYCILTGIAKKPNKNNYL